MNRPIKAVAIFTLVLSLILLINLTWIQAFQTKQLAENPKNSRQYLDMRQRQRGQISAGGQVLAQSTANEDGLYSREYVFAPEAFGSVEGYFSDRYGASGIESSQNSILTGEDDSLFAHRIWDQITGKEVRGANVELTLNPHVQQVAFDQLASKGYSGSVVAMKPTTGEILAMASAPSFNPKQLTTQDSAAADENFQALNQNPDAPLLNRSTQQTQPPGSTFKVITTAAALEAGDTPDTPVNANNQMTLPNTNTTLENYAGTRCAPGDTTTLQVAFEKSCNVPFVEMGIKHGTEAFRKTAEAFGVGDTYDGLGLPMQRSVLGEIPDAPALGQSAIGQRDVALTPLQNAVIAATIANGGTRMEPHLISKITGPDLKTLRKTKPKKLNQAVPKGTADQLRDLMKLSEQNGGGQTNIASKTGTAEHGEDSRNSAPHTWYIAFSTEADVAVAVLVENGGDFGQEATGNSVAGPIGRAVINAAAQELR